MNSMQEFSKTGSQVGKGRDGHDQETEVSCGFLKVCPLLLFCWCGNCASWMSIVAWNHKEQERFCHLRRQSTLSGTHDEYHLPWKDSITPTEENRKDIKQKEAFWWCHQIPTCSRWCLHLHPRTSSAHTSSLRLCGPSSLGVSWALEEMLNVVTYWFFSFFLLLTSCFWLIFFKLQNYHGFWFFTCMKRQLRNDITIKQFPRGADVLSWELFINSL